MKFSKITATIFLTIGLMFAFLSTAQAKVKHYNVTPIVVGGESTKNHVVELSAFSCPYCRKSFENDFDKYLALTKTNRIKFTYVPVIIHGQIDLLANKIFYLFPKNKRISVMRLIYRTYDSWVKENSEKTDYDVEASMKELIKIISENTGLSKEKIQKAFADEDYSKEIKSMSDNYFKIYKAEYTPSYILNGKIIGGSTSYNKVLKLLK